MLGVDRHREGRPKGGGIFRGLRREVQLFDPFRRQGETDESACILGHEVDGLRGSELRGNDEIALILPVFIIDQNDELAVLNIPNSHLNRIKRVAHIVRLFLSHCSARAVSSLRFQVIG